MATEQLTPHVEKVKTTCTELGSHNFSMITIVWGDKWAWLFALCAHRVPPRSAASPTRFRSSLDAIHRIERYRLGGWTFGFYAVLKSP
jgi:hypothetical protein